MMRLFNAIPKGMLVATAVSLAILVGLGTWQMSRLKWKQDLVAEMARTEALPPVPVTELLGQAKPDWRSVRLPACRIEADKLIFMHGTVDAKGGYRILTACPLPSGQSSMLVELGFSETKDVKLTGEIQSPVGRLRAFDKPSAISPVNDPVGNDWYTRSPTQMGTALKTSLYDGYFLILDTQASSPQVTQLRQSPLTAPLSNRHLEYALTWYGLAAALMGIVIAYAAQRAKAA